MWMKKSIICTLCAIVMLYGCADNTATEEHVWPREVAQMQSEEIIEHVVNKDKEALKEMFCDYVKENHDLDAEIEIIINDTTGEVAIGIDAWWGMEYRNATFPTPFHYVPD